MRQVLAVIVTVLLPLSSFADEPIAPAQRHSQHIEQLLRRIEQLEKQVAALESRVEPCVAPVPWYKQGKMVAVIPPASSHAEMTPHFRPAVKATPGRSVEEGMKADEIEHQQRIYLRHQGLERLDPAHPPYPRRAIGRD